MVGDERTQEGEGNNPRSMKDAMLSRGCGAEGGRQRVNPQILPKQKIHHVP